MAVISTAVFYSLFAGRLNGASTAPEAAHVQVVVAAHDLAAGSVLSNTDLTAIPWAGGSGPKGSYDSLERVTGKTVFTPMLQGEPVLESRLAARDGTGSGIPDGMRAVSVHISDSSGVVHLLKPGYKVDVQVFSSRSARGPKDEVRTLLRGVSVLSVNPQPEQSSQSYFSAPVVTLLASARDAEELAQADSYARLRLTLRNPLEKTAPPPPLPAPDTKDRSAVRLPPGARFHVKAVTLTDEGLAGLASRFDSRIGSNRINVIVTAGSMSVDDVVRLVQSGDSAQAEAESLVTAPFREWSSFDLPRDRDGAFGRVRLLFAPLEGGRGIRIRPEVTGIWSGRVETRSLETELQANPGRVILISGLDRGEDAKWNRRFRHLILVVVPEPNVAPKSVG